MMGLTLGEASGLLQDPVGVSQFTKGSLPADGLRLRM
jgi:hypothetical protein